MSVFSHVYWPFIFLPLRTACSWPLPICCHLAFHLFLIDLWSSLYIKEFGSLSYMLQIVFTIYLLTLFIWFSYPTVLNHTVKLIIISFYGSWVWRSCFESPSRWFWFKSCTGSTFFQKKLAMNIRVRKDLRGCIIQYFCLHIFWIFLCRKKKFNPNKETGL